MSLFLLEQLWFKGCHRLGINTTETPHFNDLSCPVDGSFIEKDTAIRTDMFLHRIKVFTQSKIVLIFSDFFLLGGQVFPSHPSKMPNAAEQGHNSIK